MSQYRVEMTFDEFHDYPRRLGWKHEYYDGALHLSPSWTAVASYKLTLQTFLNHESAIGDSGIAFRTLSKDAQEPLLTLFCECFEDGIDYAGYDKISLMKNAHRSLDTFFRDEKHQYYDACYLACADRRIVGAALIDQCQDGAILQPIFVSKEYRRVGVATALLSRSVGVLSDLGIAELHSRCNLGNEASTAWHLRCGFMEIPNRYSAGHRANIYSAEAQRHERLNLSTASAIRELADFWINERERLEECD